MKKPQTWIECTEDGRYCVKNNSGVISYHETYESAKTKSNFHNNEGAFRNKSFDFDAQSKRRAERREEKRKEEENNRKSKKTDEKYIFVVSCLLRGESGVVYLQGETKLTKITNKYDGGFITSKVESAKKFQTKSSAQKYIDGLSNCWMVNALFRSMKVVRKAKK